MSSLRPQFRFGVSMMRADNFKKYQNQNNQLIVCYADSYDIKEDGSLMFYHHIKIDQNQITKLPVLTYPHGKWEACVLIDDNNQLPVFDGGGILNMNAPVQYQPMTKSQTKSQQSHQEDRQQEDDLRELDVQFSTNVISNDHLKESNDSQSNNYTPPFYQGNQSIQNSGGYQIQGVIPGLNGSNPEEFKKRKIEWIEKEVKSYISQREVEFFQIENFLKHLKKYDEYKKFKLGEQEVSWAISTMLKKKQLMPTKFVDSVMQKTLSLILPDVMKRHYDGKMAPIMTILSEKEETKNATVIDLCVWMLKNGYNQ